MGKPEAACWGATPAWPRFCWFNWGLRALYAAFEGGFWLPAVHQASTDLNKPRRPHFGRPGVRAAAITNPRERRFGRRGPLAATGRVSRRVSPLVTAVWQSTRVGRAFPGRLGIRKKLASPKWQFSFCLPLQSFACFCLLCKNVAAVGGGWGAPLDRFPQRRSTDSVHLVSPSPRASGRSKAGLRVLCAAASSL